MFYKLLSFLFKLFVYRGYFKKYSLGKNFRFNGFLIRIVGQGNIIAGDNSYISFYSYINVAEGSKLVIGSNVSIAHNVKIYTSSFDSLFLLKTGEKKMVKGDIVIGNNVLIGSNTFINPGVKIGDNVIVGANSVITKDLFSNGIYAGSPAKKIRGLDS